MESTIRKTMETLDTEYNYIQNRLKEAYEETRKYLKESIPDITDSVDVINKDVIEKGVFVDDVNSILKSVHNDISELKKRTSKEAEMKKCQISDFKETLIKIPSDMTDILNSVVNIILIKMNE